VDSELYFQWPGVTRPSSGIDDDEHVDDALADARREIERLEVDRRTARLRIEHLEAAHEHNQHVIAAQRHRLLVLERQFESAQLLPAPEAPARTSWLDRLLGGSSPTPSSSF
jgi:hypothetical protein